LKDTSQTDIQILWEYDHLRKADAILFWFCAESVCPITLYQLGSWTQISKETGTKIFVGCHPEYTRLDDVIVQTELALSTTIKVARSLQGLVSQITEWESSLLKSLTEKKTTKHVLLFYFVCRFTYEIVIFFTSYKQEGTIFCSI